MKDEKKEIDFEKFLESMGVKILTIKKRNIFSSFFSVYRYKVKFEFENKIFKINAWAGLFDPKKEYICFSIFNYLSRAKTKQELDLFLNKYKERLRI